MSPSERYSADPSVRVKSADGRRSAREGLDASGSGQTYRRYPASDAAARQLAGMACATTVRRGLATGLDGERGRSGRTAGNGPNAIRGRTYMPSWNDTPTENETGASDGRRLGMEGIACAGIPWDDWQRSYCYAHPGARAVRRPGSGSP